jgi:hypothetical protein
MPALLKRKVDVPPMGFGGAEFQRERLAFVDEHLADDDRGP